MTAIDHLEQLPQAEATALVVPSTKAAMRGVFHHFASVGAATAGMMLVADAPTALGRSAAAIYAAGLTLMFLASTCFHRPQWGPKAMVIAWRIDHAAIFVKIASTYHPFAVLALPWAVGQRLLLQVWVGAAIGVLFSLFGPTKSFCKHLSAALYLGLGWIVLPYIGQLRGMLDFKVEMLVVLGGLVYTLGAIVFALGWPNPKPHVFDAHCVFHVFVVIAASLHFVGIRNVVMSHQLVS